jgi:Putative lumazine-binding
MMEADISEICSAVEGYFDGLRRGDAVQLRHVFDPQAQIVGYYHDSFFRQSMDEWMLEVEGSPKPSDQSESSSMSIITMDIADTVAVVRTSVLYLGLRFSDILTLVKLDGWKITHKAYSHK